MGPIVLGSIPPQPVHFYRFGAEHLERCMEGVGSHLPLPEVSLLKRHILWLFWGAERGKALYFSMASIPSVGKTHSVTS